MEIDEKEFAMSRTGTVAQLYNHAEEPVLSMHRSDMERRQLQSGDIVNIASRRGNLVACVKESGDVMPTQTFFPMHWGSQQMNGAGCNMLTTGAFDPVSKQPEFKHAAIKVEKLDLPWRMVLMRRGGEILELLQALQPYLRHFDYASCGLYGRGDGMVILRAAHAEPVPQILIDELDVLLGLTEDTPCLTYRDPKRGISKRVVVEDGKVTGVRLVGETLAAEWLKEIMTQNDFPEDVRQWALAPVSTPPQGKLGRGHIICNCLDVSENEIKAALAEGADLATLQCGTQCGSCIPELKRLTAFNNGLKLPQ